MHGPRIGANRAATMKEEHLADIGLRPVRIDAIDVRLEIRMLGQIAAAL